jgi:hypothetical protein
LLDEGEIKIEGSASRFNKMVDFSDKLVIFHTDETLDKVIAFVDEHVRTNPMLSSHIDKCDRGIHYIKINKSYKKEIMEVVKKLDREEFDYELLPFDLSDILYSKFSKSICDGFNKIDLGHIDKPKKPLMLVNGFWAMVFIFAVRLKCRYAAFCY